MSRRRQDRFGRQAKRDGYAARSVYKLEEIDRKLKLLRRGARVLDLGAYPGSWTAYAAKKVRREGNVVGYDLQPFRGELPPNAVIHRADVFEIDVAELDSYDVVMSDMAPATSGHRFTDQARSFDLFMRALSIAEQVLSPGGNFVAKIFQGEDFQKARDSVRRAFQQTKIVRPQATRRESYEVFIAGLRFKAEDDAEDNHDG